MMVHRIHQILTTLSLNPNLSPSPDFESKVVALFGLSSDLLGLGFGIG